MEILDSSDASGWREAEVADYRLGKAKSERLLAERGAGGKR